MIPKDVWSFCIVVATMALFVLPHPVQAKQNEGPEHIPSQSLDARSIKFSIVPGGMPLGAPRDGAVVDQVTGNAVVSFADLSLWVLGTINDSPIIVGGSSTTDGFAFGTPSSRSDPSGLASHAYVTSGELVRFKQTGRMTSSIEQWPWLNGAPVLDGDSIESNYDPSSGDLPVVKGSGLIWWNMYSSKDRGQDHDFLVSTLAYVHGGEGMQARTLFLETTITNTGLDTVSEFSVALGSSVGGVNDMFAGTDTAHSAIFFYPGNSTLEFPAATERRTTSISIISDSGRPSDAIRNNEQSLLYSSHFVVIADNLPDTKLQRWNILRGLQKNGEPVYQGGIGTTNNNIPTDRSKPTRIMFPGDPVSQQYWSMDNINGVPHEWFAFHADGRKRSDLSYGTLSTAPFDLLPGDSRTTIFAITIGPALSKEDGLTTSLGYRKVLTDYSDILTSPSVSTTMPHQGDEESGRNVLSAGVPFPNPANDRINIQINSPEVVSASFSIVDVLGRERNAGVNSLLRRGGIELAFDTSRLTTGVYFLRIAIAGRVFVRSFVVD